MTDTGRNRYRVCVIGAGLTGLVAACRLLDAGHDVVLLESTLQPGGMMNAFSMGQTRIEYIYHHAFTHDQNLVALLDRLGMADDLKWYEPHDALFAFRQIHPFSTPLDLLRFPYIPFSQRLRTGLAVLRAGRLKNWQALEQLTAKQWLLENSGHRAYQCLWEPLLRSKFDLNAPDVSAVWIWNKFKLRGQSRKKRSGKEQLGYLSGSFGRLIDVLVGEINAKGCDVLTGHTAMNIGHNPSVDRPFRVSCILENCETVQVDADAVIATVSSRQFVGMTTSLKWPASYQKKLEQVQYKGDLCLVLRLKHQLSRYYWTTICDDMPFVVVVEHTNLVGTHAYGGHVVYLSRYLDLSDPLWTQPDGEIFNQFIRGLGQVYPSFSPSDIMDWRLRRTRYAQPVIKRDYSQQMPNMNTPIPGIKLAGMAQIYPEDRGMNYAIQLGNQAARSVLDDLKQTDRSSKKLKTADVQATQYSGVHS